MAQSDKTQNLLDLLAATKGYDMALMTSFNFEIPFFERAILTRLYTSDVRKISLFVDAGQFVQALSEVDESSLGRKYMVSPVRINASFHPKVILLLGERAARLIIGSANITTSGYARNNEAYNYIDYSPEHPEYLDVICSAIDFFEEIHNIPYGLDPGMISEAKEKVYYHRSPANDAVRLIHNLSHPIIDQWAKQISDPVGEVWIAVPYYDRELLALKQVHQYFPNASISLYVQNEKSTFPVQEEIDGDWKVFPFDGFGEEPKGAARNFYHGKVFLAKTDARDYVLYGSANCTQAALTASYPGGGNIECDFLEIGESGAYDPFFQHIHVQEGETLTSQLQTFSAASVDNYYFKYGEEKDGMELHIGYNQAKTGVKIVLDGRDLTWKEVPALQEYVVWIPEEWGTDIGAIFEVTIIYDGKQEVLRCWSFSRSILENNRKKTGSMDTLTQFELDSEDSKYREDRIRLLNAAATCYTDLEEEQKTLAYFRQIESEQEEGEEDEEYILNIEIPDEYRVAYRQYKVVTQIRSLFIDRVLHSTGSWFLDEDDGADTPKNPNENIRLVTGYSRRATSEEKNFEYFVKKRVREMQGKRFLEEVSFEHYWGMTEVILDVLHKYHDQLKVEDIFQTPYVIRVRSELYAFLLEKMANEEYEKETNQALLKRCYELLFRDYLLREKEQVREIQDEYDKWNKKLLLAIDRAFDIRTVYHNHIVALKLQGYHSLEPGKIGKYLENLFGYKNYPLLVQFIEDRYPGGAVSIDKKTMVIRTRVSDLSPYGRPDTAVLSEISKYDRNEHSIDRVAIILEKERIEPGKNTLQQIYHRVGLAYHRWTATRKWSNGTEREGKSEYLNF